MDFDDLPAPIYEGLVDPNELSVDGQNPNSMRPEMFEHLKDRMRERGWIGNAILTDSDGLVADGEHRLRAAMDLGLKQVPVKKLDISDSERRMIRQEMNKIHGYHDPQIDSKEFEKILNSNQSDAADSLLEAREEDWDEILNPSDDWEDFDNSSNFVYSCPSCGHEFDFD